MCGIFCYFCTNGNTCDGDRTLQSCLELLQNRGPNHDAKLWYESSILFYASVLWHQGTLLCRQPAESGQTVLIFNGDIFQKRENENESDTVWLLKRIDACQSEGDLCYLFAHLYGPYSVIFLRKHEKRIYFARDRVGRNSLLFGKALDGSGNVFISSVSGNVGSSLVRELPPYGLYFIDLEETNSPFGLLSWTDECAEVEHFFDSKIIIKFTLPPEEREFSNDTKHDFSFHTFFANEPSEDECLFDNLCKSPDISNISDLLLSTLRESVRVRVVNTKQFCTACGKARVQCVHSKVGVLFSGGIDCTILALLADEFVPAGYPIDLLNVGFEKVSRSNLPPLHIDWNVPDRVTGRASLEELRCLKPNREWNFVEINVSRKELEEKRKHIASLVFPLQNVLDESLGAALWFASKGTGVKDGEPYRSTCRVLLLGSGADELFGGYTRHKAAFERCLRSNNDIESTEDRFQKAFEALEDELNLDWKRLPSRNLARDDRVISDNGVTPRTPYLEEDFIMAVRALKAFQRCYHPLGPGVGDKLILRICAYKLGLTQACSLRKRALQFGSRIADRKQNATDRSVYLEG